MDNATIKKILSAIESAGYGADSIRIDEIGIRVGYWKQITTELLNELNAITPIEESFDDDDDCGPLYFYPFVK